MRQRQPSKKFVPEPYDYHQEIEVTVDSLSNLGDGVARDGEWVIFVPFALPDERVKIRIWKNEKNCSHADLIEIRKPSPHRVEPKCRLFGECGGCQYQHLSYDEQLQWKTKQVSELLTRLAGVTHPVNDAIPSPKQWNYRSKITPHFQKARNGKLGDIGFLRKGTRQAIIDVDHCHIAMEDINDCLPTTRAETHQRAASYKKGATLLFRSNGDKVFQNPRDIMSESVGGLTFRFLAGDFFQNNPYILPTFVEYAAKQARHGSRYLVDAYCGSGLFGLSLAPHFEQVAMVEVSETGADWARYNAKANEIKNATILTAPAENIFDEITFTPDETTILIDPPRKGCDEAFLNQLFTFKPARVVYISCNPATQARDLEFFHHANYVISDVQPIDLFPQTRHLECIVTLSSPQKIE